MKHLAAAVLCLALAGCSCAHPPVSAPAEAPKAAIHSDAGADAQALDTVSSANRAATPESAERKGSGAGEDAALTQRLLAVVARKPENAPAAAAPLSPPVSAQAEAPGEPLPLFAPGEAITSPPPAFLPPAPPISALQSRSVPPAMARYSARSPLPRWTMRTAPCPAQRAMPRAVQPRPAPQTASQRAFPAPRAVAWQAAPFAPQQAATPSLAFGGAAPQRPYLSYRYPQEGQPLHKSVYCTSKGCFPAAPDGSIAHLSLTKRGQAVAAGERP